MTTLLTIFNVLGLTTFLIGLQTLFYYPLALIFALRRPKSPSFETDTPLVSIVVPAYNEEKVIRQCVESILASDYPNREVILVDDGSTDGTLNEMRRYQGHPDITVVTKPNAGKASALNAGLALAKGEVVFFVDADGLFVPDTVSQMLQGFHSDRVGAVCGNDSPVNLDRLQTRLATLQTHVGSGFVRRALATINCLPIVSGNIGAFRRSVLEETGPLLEGFIGEDLELTWRVHRAGYQVAFQPAAIVYAEVPSTLRGLWRQRVRWARGLLQTARIHRGMFFNRRYGPFGFYLPLNYANMVVVPLLQLAAVILLPLLLLLGSSPITFTASGMIGWLGLGFTLLASIFAIGLDRAWRDLRYLYLVPLWVPYSLLMDAVALWALILELRGSESRWNKLERTGVVSPREPRP